MGTQKLKTKPTEKGHSSTLAFVKQRGGQTFLELAFRPDRQGQQQKIALPIPSDLVSQWVKEGLIQLESFPQ
jgi:hypothetical protein